ncbi:MarR family transcriptional regulator [Geotalea sp. SG265]|uniref:MarR family winged helix-turn-helix transcriptional regulator n=1 Tax=Geotalea sp. SG265 TaxID=2922867 RepID=UPI001FAFC43C|nr:MarR family transcriptional regulator [Geotalea sp. SG265]
MLTLVGCPTIFKGMNGSNIAHIIGVVREKINRYLARELERCAVKGLVASHGSILYHLFQEEQVSMKKLAEVVGRDKSTVTVLVDKLVNLGYVTKNSSGPDQRYSYVSLTKDGRALEPAFREISDNLLATIFKNVSEKERNEVVRILSKIDSNL